jgi:CheY-like chemotaxis protein
MICTTLDSAPSYAVADDLAVLRILIVEDHADGADSLAMLLGLYGYDVVIARDGPNAVERARDYRPDVVLLDLGLPKMSGYDVARQMAGLHPERRPFLVAVTGYGRDEDRRRSAEAGIDLHLVKPVDPERLCSILERFQKPNGAASGRPESGMTPKSGLITPARPGTFFASCHKVETTSIRAAGAGDDERQSFRSGLP